MPCSHQKISHQDKNSIPTTKTLELRNIVGQMDLTDIDRVFHPEDAQYTFLSEAMEFSSKSIIF
jgi:hypothetical protein